ncbi:hypothetical protein [Anaerococcus sp. Marseille-P3625]|uniref:hypothetical protein n=1 Tax=Anaerococcus sp. Marseille-P3625 TaxID=1977277 RepID=UPI000C0891D9|nr:hypothetical protein [Anaerococcus sp. Marseille-P3625]
MFDFKNKDRTFLLATIINIIMFLCLLKFSANIFCNALAFIFVVCTCIFKEMSNKYKKIQSELKELDYILSLVVFALYSFTLLVNIHERFPRTTIFLFFLLFFIYTMELVFYAMRNTSLSFLAVIGLIVFIFLLGFFNVEKWEYISIFFLFAFFIFRPFSKKLDKDNEKVGQDSRELSLDQILNIGLNDFDIVIACLFIAVIITSKEQSQNLIKSFYSIKNDNFYFACLIGVVRFIIFICIFFLIAILRWIAIKLSTKKIKMDKFFKDLSQLEFKDRMVRIFTKFKERFWDMQW